MKGAHNIFLLFPPFVSFLERVTQQKLIKMQSF